MHIAVVGAGIAGAMLTWRLRQARPDDTLTLYTGATPSGDATAASGGMVRGFDPDPALRRLAARSLAEMYADPRWRTWSHYREIGSVHVLSGPVDPAATLDTTEHWLPGSASLLDERELRGLGLRGLPPGTVAVSERRAGHVSPARWRATLVEQLAKLGVRVRQEPVIAVADGARLTLAGGHPPRVADLVVVAAGAWTEGLLRAGGLIGPPLRTKQIQYTVSLAEMPPVGAFVDETSGLYGRPLSHGATLLGLPTSRWNVDPAAVTVDEELVDTLIETVWRRFGVRIIPAYSTASFDCYADPAGLALRACGPGVFTFTGGSGGAVKTVLAASRDAETLLTSRLAPAG